MSFELSTRDIGERIYFVRGHHVMLDADLALLYDVETKALNRGVRRNIDRFPEDFMFQLTNREHESLRYQIGTLKAGRGAHRKYPPLVFTEQGVAMLSSVLNSKYAIQVNIAIMRTFVKVRELLANHKELAQKINELEKKFDQHDQHFKRVFDAIRHFMAVGSPLTQKRIKGLGRE